MSVVASPTRHRNRHTSYLDRELQLLTFWRDRPEGAKVKRVRLFFLREYETTCGLCGFQGKGNGNKPAKCPACGNGW